MVFFIGLATFFSVGVFPGIAARWHTCLGPTLLVHTDIRERLRTSDMDLERLDDKKEARAGGGRRFQREGPITEKDLDMAMVVPVIS